MNKKIQVIYKLFSAYFSVFSSAHAQLAARRIEQHIPSLGQGAELSFGPGLCCVFLMILVPKILQFSALHTRTKITFGDRISIF
jgi:hypothetical protein